LVEQRPEAEFGVACLVCFLGGCSFLGVGIFESILNAVDIKIPHLGGSY